MKPNELNPASPSLIPGFYADPNIIEFDGVFYIYLTTDGLNNWSSSTFRAFSSINLVDWVDHDVIFSLSRDTRWATQFAWAPTIARKSGKYYFYFSAHDNIGVASSDSPIGNFTDLGNPLIPSGRFSGRAIDPSIFVEDDGTQYLIWGNGSLHIVPLDEDMMSFDPSKVQDFQIPNFREAAWMHKRKGIYYLSWSENDARDEDYRVAYATGLSLFGPWTLHGELISKKTERGILGTGHHSIIRIEGTDEWLVANHRFAIPDGNGYRREVVLDRLQHTAQGLLYPVIPSEYKIHIDECGVRNPQ